MNSIVNQGSSPFESIKQIVNGVERWSARDLMPMLGYRKWERFEDSIDRAKTSCQTFGQSVEENFPGSGKPIISGKGRQQEAADYLLSRYAAYLVAMNGDSRKPEIAGAQAYFFVRTVQAEQMDAAPFAPQIPTTFVEALRLALDKAEEVERLTALRERDRPKVAVAERIAIAENALPFDEAAKVLGTGRTRLFKLCRESGYLRGNNLPYQRWIDNEWFKVIEKPYEMPDGEQRIRFQALVTGKGLCGLANRHFTRAKDAVEAFAAQFGPRSLSR